MHETLRKDILELLSMEIDLKILHDFEQFLNSNYQKTIEFIQDCYLSENNPHPAQKVFTDAMLYLAEVSLAKVASKNGLNYALLTNQQNSDEYPLLSTNSFNFLIVREQAANKFRGKYKAHWASKNYHLSSKQLQIEFIENIKDNSILESLDDKITIVIEVNYTMNNIEEDPNVLVEPQASFKFSIPHSNNSHFITSYSYNELINACQKTDTSENIENLDSKPSLVSIKRRLKKVNERGGK